MCHTSIDKIIVKRQETKELKRIQQLTKLETLWI